MRILVVGTVPPPVGTSTASLARVIGDLVAEGHEVEVLSPDARSASHRHAQLNGPLLAVQLALNASRFDALVLRIETDLPLNATSGRIARTLALGLCGLALKRWKDVTIRLESPIPIPGGVGGRATADLWSAAQRIVVRNDEDKVQLIRANGVDADRVVVEPPEAPENVGELGGWIVDDEGPLREEILALVRTRAARERAVNSARLELGANGIGPDATSAFSAATPPGPSVVGLARIAYGRARRAAANLSGSRS